MESVLIQTHIQRNEVFLGEQGDLKSKLVLIADGS